MNGMNLFVRDIYEVYCGPKYRMHSFSSAAAVAVRKRVFVSIRKLL